MYYRNELDPPTSKFTVKINRLNSRREHNPKPLNKKTKIFNFIHLVFSSSNIHGLNHLTVGTRHFIEKFVWAVAICASVYGFAVLGLSAWTRYQKNPTVISMDREYREWPTELPAVTLCPVDATENGTTVDELIEEKFSDYTDTQKNDLHEFLVSLVNATYGSFKDVPMNDLIPPKQYLKYVMSLQSEVTYSVSSNIEDTSYTTELLSTVTEMGFCHSYNSEISPYNDYKYWMDHNTSMFPHLGVVTARLLDGEIFIQISDMNFGYTGFLHSSYEVPDLARGIFSSPYGFYKLVNADALSIHSSPEIKNLTPKQRGCRFMEESDLVISPVYSYNLCRNQCRMDQAKKLCGCVPFFYKPHENYKICDVKGMHCLDQYKDFLIKLRNTSGDNTKVNCGCFPSCTDVHYSNEENSVFLETWLPGSVLKWKLIRYPKMRLKRDIIFGFTDVLVSIGGNAGLFLGCSVLSFLELIYFFTFRLISILKHN